uniref:thiamine phosphate synthase n=1 Tax=Heterosigma akashiwo TaxID=2829 RepID=A0A6V1SBN4_HETAK
MAQGFDIEDAVTIAKAYITQGLGAAARLGSGPGPVAHTSWPCDPGALPWATSTAARGQHRPEFPPCQAPEEWGLYPIVDSADWVERLVLMGVKDIQIRIKDKGDDEIMEAVGRAQAACSAAGARLWVNDHWRAAVRHKTYGCHLGQEDLMENLEGIDELSAAGIRLGLSTHCYSELARAVAVRPSYVSLGPIYQTFSKQVRFAPRGLENLKQWRKLVDVPLIAIGGITYENAPKVIEAGADSIAVISAITKENDVQAAIDMWNKVFLSP